MDRSSWDQSALKEAFHLLEADARAALSERAREVPSLSGRELEPWDMIAQGRYRLRFAPRPGDGLREVIDASGDRATVTVLGADPDDRAAVPLVRERGRWRIALAVPNATDPAPTSH
jgi:hypothetical protein